MSTAENRDKFEASVFAGNWLKFDSYASGTHDQENPELWGIAYYCNRDSDLLDISNWESIQERMKPYLENETCEIQRDSHWACGWVEGLFCKVYTDATRTETTEAYEDLSEIKRELDDYPVLNEEDFSNREYEAMSENFDQVFKDVIRHNDLVRTDKEYRFYDILNWFEDKRYWSDIENHDGNGAYPNEDHLLECMLDLGYITSVYAPKYWAKENGIELEFIELKTPLFDIGSNRKTYQCVVKVNGVKILTLGNYSPSPLLSIDDIGYDDILCFLYNYLDLKDSDIENYKQAARFIESLDDTARDEFVEGMLEFRS